MVVGLKLDRWNVVERLVDSPIVEPVDVVEGLPFDVFDASPRTLAVNQLVLVETVVLELNHQRDCSQAYFVQFG